MTYDVNVTRDGRWWMIAIPAIDALTQARRVTDVEEMARSLIAVTLDVAPSKVKIGKITIKVGKKDVVKTAEEIAKLRATAAEIEAQASKLARATAGELVEADVPLRDVGALLGVSHQRAGQLVDR
jgi:hypothetical protein